MTIHDLEISVQTGLEALRHAALDPTAQPVKEVLLPEGMTPVVALVGKDGDRSKVGDAFDWNPHSGHIVISFRANLASQEAAPPTFRIPRFQPIVVRGEPVSATLLRDRGSI